MTANSFAAAQKLFEASVVPPKELPISPFGDVAHVKNDGVGLQPRIQNFSF